jgi:hypothetical protein
VTQKFRSQTRACEGCQKDFPLAEFAVGRTRVRYRPRCRPCWSDVQKVTDQKPNHRFSAMKTKARVRGTWCDLTLEEYTVLISQPCHYCDGPLPKYGGGLDRIDSDKPYSLENSVPACAYCNEIKGRALTHEEMMLMGDTVRRIRIRRAELGLPPLMSHLQIATGIRQKLKEQT